MIPVYNEEGSIAQVVAALRAASSQHAELAEIIVVDNASADASATKALEAGARVVEELERGYGAACLRGLSEIPDDADFVLFVDGDGSDFPQEWPTLIAALEDNSWDLVVGSRTLRQSARAVLLPHVRFGNWLATRLLALIYGYQFSDLGPFRAMRWDKLSMLGMRDRDFGWTIEMQVKALRYGLRCGELPVSYRKRTHGNSKVGGTLKGTVLAGYKILSLIHISEPTRPC